MLRALLRRTRPRIGRKDFARENVGFRDIGRSCHSASVKRDVEALVVEVVAC